MDKVWPPLITPEIDHPGLFQFCSEISQNSEPQLIKMAKTPMPLGNCYWNADHFSKENNCTSIMGWIITLWPESHFMAIHHSVVQLSDGSLIDVTEKLPSDSNMEYSLFLTDSSIEIDLFRMPHITCKFSPIDDSPIYREYIQAYLERNRADRRIASILYDVGYRCEAQFHKALGLQPALPALKLNQAQKAEWDQLNIELARILKNNAHAITSLRGSII